MSLKGPGGSGNGLHHLPSAQRPASQPSLPAAQQPATFSAEGSLRPQTQGPQSFQLPSYAVHSQRGHVVQMVSESAGTGFDATAPLLTNGLRTWFGEFKERIGWPSKLPYDQQPDYVPDSRPVVRIARRLGDIRPIALIPAAAILEMAWLRPFGDITFTRVFNDHWGVPEWLAPHQFATLTAVGVTFSAALFGVTKMFHRPSTWEFKERSNLPTAVALDGLLLGMYPHLRSRWDETLIPKNTRIGEWSTGDMACWGAEIAFTSLFAVPMFAWALDRPIGISSASGAIMSSMYLLGFTHMTKVLLDRGGDDAQLLNLYRIAGFNFMNGIVLAASATGVDPQEAWQLQAAISLGFTAAMFAIFRPTLPASTEQRATDMEVLDDSPADDQAA